MDNLSELIREYAFSLGFNACGFCQAASINNLNRDYFYNWLNNSFQADMNYMTNYPDKRRDPSLLVDGAKSIVCVALNYYPEKKQPPENPQIAYYAYGKDYHDVMKEKLRRLLEYIQEADPAIQGRVFCDTAPILERYWAAQSGIGFIGKNSLLIIPQKGSFFFLGELIINKELEYDKPITLSCGNCTRCMDACPTKAIEKPYVINSNRCISYQTIENKGAIASDVNPCMSNYIYGCDICQKVCPWNRFSTPNGIPEFSPSPEFLDLDFDKMQNLTEEEYRQIFKGSAIKRAKYTGLKRNIKALSSLKKQ